MSPGQFLQPDHDKGDPNTIGGYMAVHDRPAAFEGPDGFSYSVELLSEPAPPGERWGAFFLFVKWARLGAQTPEGHLETDYIAFGQTEAEAREQAGALHLLEVRAMLDLLVERHGGQGGRRWWDVMADEDETGDQGDHA